MKQNKYKKSLFAAFLVVILALSQISVYADSTTIPPAESIPASQETITEAPQAAVKNDISETQVMDTPSEKTAISDNDTEETSIPKQTQLSQKNWNAYVKTLKYEITLNGEVVTETPAIISKGNEVGLDIAWQFIEGILGEDNKVSEGDTVTFKLPKGFTIAEGFSFSVLDNDLGYFEYNRDDHTVSLTFGPGVNDPSNLEGFEGKLFIRTIFDSKETIVNEDVVIEDPFNDHIVQTFKPRPVDHKESITKTGYRDGNTTTVIWHVYVNEDYQELNDVSIEDIIPSNLTVTKIDTYGYDLTLEGNVVNRQYEKTFDTFEDNAVRVDLGDISSPKELVIYTTADKLPIIGNSVSFKNTATLISKDTPPKESNEAVVEYTLDPVIKKDGSSYNKEDRTFTWQVLINPGSIVLAKDTKVTDAITPPGILKYLNESFEFKVDGITYDYDAFLLAFKDTYELTLNNETSTFDIKYLKDAKHVLDITYKTEVPIDQINAFDGFVDNTLTLTSGTDTTNTGASGSGFDKGITNKWASIDYMTKTIDWTIQLNSGNHELNRIQLTDTLKEGIEALEYVKDSFRLINMTTHETIDVSSMIQFIKDENGKNIGFRFDYTPEILPFVDAYRLVYTTDYDPALKEPIFSNVVDTTLTTKDNVELKDSGRGRVHVRYEEITNGLKSGSYNPKDQTFTWTIYLNYNGKDINTYELVDILENNQSLIPNSVNLYEYIITERDGHFEKEEASKKHHDKVKFEDPKLTILIDKDDIAAVTQKESKRIAVEFKTSMEGNYIPESVKNTATITYGKDGLSNEKPIVVEDTVSLEDYHGGNIGEKSVNYREEKGVKYLDWTLHLNKSNSQFDKYAIHDAINNTHTYDKDSLVVYAATMDGKNVIVGKELKKDIDYTVTYQEVSVPNEPNAETMDIDFLTVSDDRMFVVTYTTIALLEVGDVTYKNTLDVNAKTINNYEKQTTKTQAVSRSFGGASVGATSQSYTIKKVDSEGNPLQGVQFELTYEKSGKLAAKGTTDAEGLIKFGPLFTGDYILREVETLPGYGISKQYRDGVKVKVNKATTDATQPETIINLRNTIRVKKSSSTDTPKDLTTTFEVRNKVDNQLIGSFTTDRDGTGWFDNNGAGLLDGEYLVIETIAPKGHILDATPQSITIEKGILFNETGENTLQFTNHMGSVRLFKVDERNATINLPIAFDLYQGDGTYVDTYTTHEGKVELLNQLEPGDYYFLEKAPAKDYIRSPETYAFTIDANQTGVPTVHEITVKNYASRIEFQKIDMQGTALSGAVFGIYESVDDATYDTLTDPVLTTTSDEQGWVRFEGLPEGDYLIKEITAPSQYLLNKQLISVRIEPSSTNEKRIINPIEEGFVNAKGSVRLIKVDGGLESDTFSTLTDVRFDLFKGTPTRHNKPIQRNLFTNTLGEITIGDLEPGDYYFVETQPKEGYFIDATPIPFTIQTTGDVSYQEVVRHANYRANVSFVKTDGVQGLEGARFTLEKDGQTVYTDVVSDAWGKVVFTNLGPGVYTYYETHAPKGYIRNTEVFTFTLDTNMEATQTLQIQAEDVVNYKGSVVLSKVDANDNPLENAHYRLIDEKGHQVGETMITDEHGRIEIMNALQPGSYAFEEVKAPDGFIRNTTLIPFIISDNAEDVPEIVNVSHTNYKASVQFQKTDANGIALSGARFAMYDDEGNRIQEALSEETGRVLFENVGPGNYTIRELEAAEGYILNTKVIAVEVMNDAENEVILTLDNFINYQGRFEITKVDPKGKIIGDATFALYDAHGEKVTTFKTRAGKALVEGLAPGHYTLKETASPFGYLISNEVLEITIDDAFEGEPHVQSFDFINEPEPIVKGVSKTPKKTLPATGISNNDALIGTSLFALGIALIALSFLRRNDEK